MTGAVDPRLTDDVVQWADYMWPTIEEFGVPARLMNESDWQDWAVGLLSLPGLAAYNIPNAYQFDDWREWAMRVFSVFEDNV